MKKYVVFLIAAMLLFSSVTFEMLSSVVLIQVNVVVLIEIISSEMLSMKTKHRSGKTIKMNIKL